MKFAVMGAGAVGCFYGGMLARGKRSEIGYLNGHVVRKGDQLSIPTPANRVLLALVKTLESKQTQEI
jgi:2-dehydropantoate 2-reductase